MSFAVGAAPSARLRMEVPRVLRRAPLPLQAAAVALLAGVAWALVGPPTADLAAQTHRVWLFAHDGPMLWDNSWYAGHHLPGYSLVFPPLGALVGTRAAGVLAAVAAAALFARLAEEHFGQRARAGVLWFALGTGADLAIGRLTYLAGVTIALLALVAAQRRHPAIACGAAALCAVTSPVAGAFLALVALVGALSRRSRAGLALGACALVPGLALSVLFPEGGHEPFLLGSAIVALVLLVALVRVLPAGARELRWGTALYTATVAAAWLVPSPMGANAVRLGVGFGAALLLCVRGTRLNRPALAALLALGVWQWAGPAIEVVKTAGNPSTQAAYFTPLVRALARHDAGRGRVEVVPTATRWETVYVARRFALARGWETQLDRRYDPLFSTPRLARARYARWLRRNAVRYVALADVGTDRSGHTEARLLAHPPPFLRLVWRSPHWRVWAVRRPDPLLQGAGRLTAITPDGFSLVAHRPGRLLVRVHTSRWWSVTAGRACVSRAGSGWTAVHAAAPGRIAVRALLSREGAGCPT